MHKATPVTAKVWHGCTIQTSEARQPLKRLRLGGIPDRLYEKIPKEGQELMKLCSDLFDMFLYTYTYIYIQCRLDEFLLSLVLVSHSSESGKLTFLHRSHHVARHIGDGPCGYHYCGCVLRSVCWCIICMPDCIPISDTSFAHHE